METTVEGDEKGTETEHWLSTSRSR